MPETGSITRPPVRFWKRLLSSAEMPQAPQDHPGPQSPWSVEPCLALQALLGFLALRLVQDPCQDRLDPQSNPQHLQDLLRHFLGPLPGHIPQGLQGLPTGSLLGPQGPLKEPRPVRLALLSPPQFPLDPYRPAPSWPHLSKLSRQHSSRVSRIRSSIPPHTQACHQTFMQLLLLPISSLNSCNPSSSSSSHHRGSVKLLSKPPSSSRGVSSSPQVSARALQATLPATPCCSNRMHCRSMCLRLKPAWRRAMGSLLPQDWSPLALRRAPPPRLRKLLPSRPTLQPLCSGVQMLLLLLQLLLQFLSRYQSVSPLVEQVSRCGPSSWANNVKAV